MSKINELRTQRAKTWDKAQAFLTANRDEKGILSEENVKIYEGLEQDIVNLGKEIERQGAMRGIRTQVAELSVKIAEKLLREELSDNAKQMELIDRLLDDIPQNKVN